MALIIGGGLAGAGCAALLARAGYSATLLERQAGPTDKICGEFLSREAQLYLQRIGLDLASLDGHRITGLRLIHGASALRVALPFAGLGLSRRVLDEALLSHAAAAGATVLRGQTARVQGAHITTPLYTHPPGAPVLLATGKHDLHGQPRPTASAPEDLVGFKSYFALTLPQQDALSGHVEVMLFAGGYAGLQMVEGRRANLCLLVARARLQRVGFSWPRLLDDLCETTPHLRTRLEGATALLEKPLSVYRVPYGYVHRANDSMYRLGDQMAVIDSFSGDGMSIALHSAARAAAAILSGENAAQYHRRMRRDIAGQIARARFLYRFGRDYTPTLMRLARAWPGSLRLAARLTRVPEHTLLQTSFLPHAA